MTCVVGYKNVDTGVVYVGVDSSGVADDFISPRKDYKVFRTDDFIIGFAGSFRMGQIMQYHFKPPVHDLNIPAHKYMCTSFVRAMQKVFRNNGFDGENKKSEKETSGQLLVAYMGELYEIGEDFQVGMTLDKYNAIGAGMELAIGALYALESNTSLTPTERITIALEAAAKYNTSVIPPFTVYNTLGDEA